MRKVILTYQKNIRDLGGLIGYQGKKVKEGRIYRGGFLGRVSEEDIPIVDSLHLTDIIDFRGAEEFVNRPDYPFDGVTFHNYPMMKEDVKKEKSKTEDSNLLWFLEDQTNGFKHMYELYPGLLTNEVGITALRKFFELLTTKNNGVFYYHCSQGKDRAGLASYLLEVALGVDESVCREDYFTTNEAMEIRVKKYIEDLHCEPFYNETYEKSLKDVFFAKADYLDHALEVVKEKYGTLENYLRNELKVDIEKLRALYLK